MKKKKKVNAWGFRGGYRKEKMVAVVLIKMPIGYALARVLDYTS